MFFWQIESDFLACVDLIYVVSHRETIKYMNNMSGNHELEDETQKNKVRPAGRTEHIRPWGRGSCGRRDSAYRCAGP